MRIGSLRIRPTRRGWTFVALAALLLASYTADAVVTIGRVRSGVQAGSLKLGGKTRDEAKKLLDERAELLISQPVELFADNHRITVSPSEIGFRPDVDATLDAAAEVGRTGNFIVRLWHRVRSLFASTDVGWESTHDTKAAKLLVERLRVPRRHRRATRRGSRRGPGSSSPSAPFPGGASIARRRPRPSSPDSSRGPASRWSFRSRSTTGARRSTMPARPHAPRTSGPGGRSR